MDESSLLDLLECSVCLERLDTSAKVLPCQHTFCRRCLENIVSSRHELRCPECRILVDCAVDDLPANILLVRLLDGIKQRPRNGGGRAANVSDRSLCLCIFQNVPQLPCGKALYSYEGKEAGDLKFNKGDIIILRRKVDENWFHGELNGSHGFLPASYIQCIRPLSQTPPQGKALYDFEVKDKDQDKDCLTFTKDEILTVIRRVDDNWAEGMLGDKIGIFPILYVELNETAKQLMEMDKPSASAEAVSCNGNGAHRHAEGKKNAKKRHSFTALSVTQRSAQVLGNNRHSMEISAPVLISSSDPRAAARIADCPHLSSSAPATQVQTHTPVLQHTSYTDTDTHTCPPAHLPHRYRHTHTHLSSSAPATQVQTHTPVTQVQTHAPATQVQTHTHTHTRTCPPAHLPHRYRHTHLPHRYRHTHTHTHTRTCPPAHLPHRYRHTHLPHRYRHTHLPYRYRHTHLPHRYRHTHLPHRCRHTHLPHRYRHTHLLFDNIGHYILLLYNKIIKWNLCKFHVAVQLLY
uniref:RING-type E3 ubiquitin transferase n=1 Tax=Cyprinus carpio carpio TaxID=630221 RepID=A0A9J8AQ27_CYPCA